MYRLRFLLIPTLLLLTVIPCASQVTDSTDAIVADSIPGQQTEFSEKTVFSSIERIEALNKELVSWNILLRKTIDTTLIISDIQTLQDRLSKSRQLLGLRKNSSNLRYLAGNRIIVDEILAQVRLYQSQTRNYFNKLHQIEREFYHLGLDSMEHGYYKDLSLQQLYSEQLRRLSIKWESVKEANEATMIRLGLLQGHLSELAMEAVDLQQQIRFSLQNFNKNLFQEKHPLLTSSRDDSLYVPMKDEVNETIDFARQLLLIYVSNESAVFFWNLVIALFMLAWIYQNHRFLKKKDQYSEDISLHARRVSRHPFAAGFTILFCLSTFFYRNPPFIIAALFIFGLLISLSFLLWDTMRREIRWRWIGIIFVFIRFSLVNLVVDISYFERWLMVGLNLGCIYLLFSSYKLISPRVKRYRNLFLLIILITATQQLLAVIFNFMGYFNAARIFSINSIFNIITAAALKLSIDVIIELLYMFYTRLQFHGLIDKSRDFTSLRRLSYNTLAVFGIIAWLFVFARTINIYNYLYDVVNLFLTQPRTIGEVNFTFGSIAVFLAVFLAGILLSRLIGMLIDLVSGTTRRFSGLKNTKLLFRLFIIVAGVIIAFIASGIPMDRFTIILGALSVGIGFGLQHLVNNIVSGIIIAMEKPIRVGDKIELAPYTGVVVDIGLRSSVMKTSEGSDIVIPNGELLSSKLVNWTLSGRRRRVSIEFYITLQADLETVRKVINEIITPKDGILQYPEPELLFRELSLYGIRVELLIWVKDIIELELVKSELIAEIIEKMNANKVKMVANVNPVPPLQQ